MYRYLCLSFCCKNKVRICANNRNGWLSEGEPLCSISCRQSVICFHFPLVSLWSRLFLRLLLSPLCQSSDWMPGLGMNTTTLAFSCFAPTVPPRGPLEVYILHSYSAQESSQESPSTSDPQAARICVSCGYTSEKKIDYFLFCKDTLFLVWR